MELENINTYTLVIVNCYAYTLMSFQKYQCYEMDFELKECQKYRPDHTMYLLISIDANPCLNTVNYKNTKKSAMY